ncbi:hypothetical protein CUA47_16395, partial [Shigella dysenteriae]
EANMDWQKCSGIKRSYLVKVFIMFPASAGINRTCYHFLSCRTYVPRVSGDNYLGMFRPGSFPPGLPHSRIRPALDRIRIPQFPMHHFIRFFQDHISMFG